MKSPVSIFLLLLILSIIVPSTISFVEKIGDKKAMAEIEASAQQSYYVTVDAGFSNGAQGKTSIELSDGISHVVLSSGDRLYVRAVISGTAPEKILAGYLTMSDVEKGAPKATFNGALLPYEWNESQNRYVNTKHDFNNVDDPLSECENVYAMFVGKDADNFRIGDDDKRGFYSASIASDVKTLRMRCLEVFGTYDNSTRFIALNSDNPSVCAPIFNYSISGGLTPNATYNVL